MAYAQWVDINIQPKNIDVKIKNPVHEWGKFYAGSKDNEIDPSKIDNTIINKEDSYHISACGRSDAAAGTEGSFDLYHDNTHIGTYYWCCPWGSKTNTSTWTSSSDNYIVQNTGGNLDSGALGNVTLKIFYIG